MPFKVGDRVVLDHNNHDYNLDEVGENNIGTITRVDIFNKYYEINWDNKGPSTYKMGFNNNQWNVGFDYVILYSDKHTYDNVKDHPNKSVILKVISMNNRRKELGHTF